MKCSDVEILLQLAADGEITDEERIAIETHLERCVACRRIEAWLELLGESFETIHPTMEDSADLAYAVINNLMSSESIREAPVSVTSQVRSVAGTTQRGAKKGIISRIAALLWSRRKQRRQNRKSKREQSGPAWVETSVSVLQSAPTSLEGFRAAKKGIASGVSGPAQAFKWVGDILPRRRG